MQYAKLTFGAIFLTIATALDSCILKHTLKLELGCMDV